MMPLVLKDLTTIKKTLIFTVLISVAVSIYGAIENLYFMIPLVAAMTPLLLSMVAYGYDLESKFDQLAFSMPIKKTSYVMSKLFLSLLFGVLGGIGLFILLKLKSEFNLEIIFFLSIFTLFLCVLVSGIQLPFAIKFGAERGRLLMVITYFLVYAFSTILIKNTNILINIMQSLNKYSFKAIGIGVIIITLLIIVLCIKISIRLLVGKEY